MSLRRLHAPGLPSGGGVVRLAPEVARHAELVLRLRPGERVRLFDGQGAEADGVLRAGDRGVLEVEATAPEQVAQDAARIHLIQVLPKGAKLDDIVRMTTELGVHSIHLATSERCVPELGDRAERRVERLRRIAAEAARQCGRALVPEVVPPAPLAEVAARAPSTAARVLFWEMHRGVPPGLAGATDVWVVIGPEGGLSEREVAPLVDAGFTLAGLGPTVLRVETAAPVAVALVRDRLLR